MHLLPFGETLGVPALEQTKLLAFDPNTVVTESMRILVVDSQRQDLQVSYSQGYSSLESRLSSGILHIVVAVAAAAAVVVLVEVAAVGSAVVAVGIDEAFPVSVDLLRPFSDSLAVVVFVVQIVGS